RTSRWFSACSPPRANAAERIPPPERARPTRPLSTVGSLPPAGPFGRLESRTYMSLYSDLKTSLNFETGMASSRTGLARRVKSEPAQEYRDPGIALRAILQTQSSNAASKHAEIADCQVCDFTKGVRFLDGSLPHRPQQRADRAEIGNGDQGELY